MKSNLPLALIAAALTVIAFCAAPAPTENAVTGDFSVVKTLPYFLVLTLAVTGFNVLGVLMVGIFSSALIGIFSGTLAIAQVGQVINAGFLDMSEIFFLSIFVAGLSGIAMKGGAFQKIIEKCEFFIRGKRSAETVISVLVSLIDICVANNTIAILISGKIAKEMSAKYSLAAPRVASLLDIFSCVWQGLLPYGAQILLLSSLSLLAPLSIVRYSWYVILLGLVTVLSIIFQKQKSA